MSTHSIRLKQGIPVIINRSGQWSEIEIRMKGELCFFSEDTEITHFVLEFVGRSMKRRNVTKYIILLPKKWEQ